MAIAQVGPSLTARNSEISEVTRMGSVRVKTSRGTFDIVPKTMLGHYIETGYVAEVLTW